MNRILQVVLWVVWAWIGGGLGTYYVMTSNFAQLLSTGVGFVYYIIIPALFIWAWRSGSDA